MSRFPRAGTSALGDGFRAKGVTRVSIVAAFVLGFPFASASEQGEALPLGAEDDCHVENLISVVVQYQCRATCEEDESCCGYTNRGVMIVVQRSCAGGSGTCRNNGVVVFVQNNDEGCKQCYNNGLEIAVQGRESCRNKSIMLS